MTIVSVLGILLFVLGLTYHFAALRIFNALVPKDDARLLASDIAYGSHLRQRYDLYRPNTQDQDLPVLVFVYGGSWDSGDRRFYEFAGKAFASRGYLTAVLDYRIVPDVLYPAFVDDVALAVAHLKANVSEYGGNSNRIYMVGHSAGAYNLMHAVLHPQYTEQMKEIKAVATLAGPFDFLPLDSPKSIAAFQHYIPLKDTQPINHARADAPPMLIMHGADDDTVKLKNAKNLSARMKLVGGVAELKIYPSTSHVGIIVSLAKPFRNRAPAFADIIEYFRRYP